MSSLLPLKRTHRTRTRKSVVSVDDTFSHRKTRPPPLQIIPELSENELDSPTTARATHFYPKQPPSHSSRITLSAFSFSIDDALLMFSDMSPRSPALSASSSTTGSSIEDIPATPGASDDEDGCDSLLPTPHLRPRPVSVRPLCITKSRSLICQDDEDIHNYSEMEQENGFALLLTPVQPYFQTMTEETAQEFYTREFQDFISLSPVEQFHSAPARRDSLILTVEVLSAVVEVPQPKLKGHSRHSKPLPLPPPSTPPLSSFPSIFPLVQITARTSVVRRKRNISPSPPPNYPPPLPLESRPLPRMAIPLDIEDCIFREQDFDDPSSVSNVTMQIQDTEEESNTYSQHSSSTSTCRLPETSPLETYDAVTLSRSSTDSDAPRSSVDSASSFASSSSSNAHSLPSYLPCFEDDEFEDTQCLRSRWSSSTLGSVVVESPRTGTLLSPFKHVLGSRVRRAPPQKVPPRTPPQRTPPKVSKNRLGFPTTPSPASSPSKHIRRQDSQSSTSSAETSSSGRKSRDGSPTGPQKKPIPMLMFFRTT